MEEQLEQLSYVQSAMIGIGLAASYYFFVYSVTSYDAVIKEAEHQITQDNADIVKVDALIREKQELEAELLKNEELVKSSRSVVTEDFDTSLALDRLTTKARSYGLSIESISSFSEWVSELQFVKSSLNLGLQGTYEQMMFFLSDFTREKGFYTFKDLSLISANEFAEGSQNLSIGITVVVLKLMDSETKEGFK